MPFFHASDPLHRRLLKPQRPPTQRQASGAFRRSREGSSNLSSPPVVTAMAIMLPRAPLLDQAHQQGLSETQAWHQVKVPSRVLLPVYDLPTLLSPPHPVLCQARRSTAIRRASMVALSKILKRQSHPVLLCLPHPQQRLLHHLELSLDRLQEAAVSLVAEVK